LVRQKGREISPCCGFKCKQILGGPVQALAEANKSAGNSKEMATKDVYGFGSNQVHQLPWHLGKG
jgi:hypothetical protein